MITDPVFYRLFATSPETFFLVLGMSTDSAREMAARYQYKLPRLSREEIQAMLQVHDIRQTRVYQEAKEEGRKEGIEQGLERGIEKGIEEERQRSSQEKLRAIAKMSALKMSAETIADLLDLDVELVRKELAKNAT